MKTTRTTGWMRCLLGLGAVWALAACANMGRPGGGERDVDPPVFIGSNPAPGALNVNREKITITFDENVQIKDAMSKVVVSPAQQTPPTVMAVGRNVTVTLRDTLVPNTTYTIDFADGISDLNEGNELDGFSFAFSTGPTIDTLQISGMVFQASNLEPAQGMMVGVYSNLSDTAVTTLKMERITKTNQLGQFTIRNLKEGSYRIFAINDMNRDYHWDRSEDVAFYDAVITPTAQNVMVNDTLKNQAGEDSIVVRQATQYLPNDILLTWFNEGYKAQYLAKYERPMRNRVTFEMGAPADSLPHIALLNDPRGERREINRWSVLKASPTLDSLEYWIADPEVVAMDSLKLETRYRRTDSLDRIVWYTDTLMLNVRGEKKKKEEKKKKNEEEDTTEVKIPLISFSVSSGTSQELNRPMIFTSASPIVDFNQGGVHFQKMVDTLWVDVEAPRVYFPDSLNPMLMRADVKWEPKTQYKLVIDSLAITDVNGLHNKGLEHKLTTKAEEDYSSLSFSISNLPGPAMVELLSAQDAPVARVKAVGGKATFKYLQPGTFYARLWIDRNENGIWDTGSLLDSVQPEEVYYYPNKITLKKNWDIADQEWDIYANPVDRQKPDAIKKNKPKKKAGEMPEANKDDDEEEFGSNYNPADPFNSRNRNNRGNLRNNNGGAYNTNNMFR